MSYGKFSQLLHRLALNSDARCEAMFDFERSMHRDRLQHSDNHVFVCGLARAGTTITMQHLYETGKFSSLTYRDMPFLMMPNLWKKISAVGRKQMQQAERAHGDGIEIDFDSPEALEEVFWRVHTGHAYIARDTLVQYEVESEVLEKFGDYVALLNLRGTSKRYLSKNNNNILRISSIVTAFPGSHVLILFRDPLTQAASLLRQHERFLDRHAEDAFSKTYMAWLVHHEFGSDHRQFRFRAYRPDPQSEDELSLAYWLAQWRNVYVNLVEQHSSTPNAVFLCYEDLCHPNVGALVWRCLLNMLEAPQCETKFRQSDVEVTGSNVESMLPEAREIYQRMRFLSAQRLGYPLQ